MRSPSQIMISSLYQRSASLTEPSLHRTTALRDPSDPVGRSSKRITSSTIRTSVEAVDIKPTAQRRLIRMTIEPSPKRRLRHLGEDRQPLSSDVLERARSCLRACLLNSPLLHRGFQNVSL